MGQKSDLIEYRQSIARSWTQLEDEFMKSDEVIKTRKALVDYGIKEPYAGNIIARLFYEAYAITTKYRIIKTPPHAK